MHDDSTIPLILNSLKFVSEEKLLKIIAYGAKISPEFLKYLEKITHNDKSISNIDKYLDQINSYLNYDTSISDKDEQEEMYTVCSNIINNIEKLIEFKQSDKVIGIANTIILFFNDCITSEETYYEENYYEEDYRYDYDNVYLTNQISDLISKKEGIFIDALKQSSLNDVEKLLYVIQYDDSLTWSIFEQYLKEEFSKDILDKCATALLNILNGKNKDVEFNLDRERVINYTIKILKKSERNNDLITLCENEVKIFNQDAYIRLIQFLLEFKDYEKCDIYISKALSHNDLDSHFIENIKKFWLEVKMAQNDLVAVTILQVEKFVNELHDVNQYCECKTSAEKLSIWIPLRKTILNYLETGTLPWQQPEWPRELSDHNIQPIIWKNLNQKFPFIRFLLDIALQEKSVENIIYWYDKINKDPIRIYHSMYYDNIDEKVANTLYTLDPECSISILKKVVDNKIKSGKVVNYPTAVFYLKRIKNIMLTKNQDLNWNDYINTIKSDYRRKYHLIKLLKDL